MQDYIYEKAKTDIWSDYPVKNWVADVDWLLDAGVSLEDYACYYASASSTKEDWCEEILGMAWLDDDTKGTLLATEYDMLLSSDSNGGYKVSVPDSGGYELHLDEEQEEVYYERFMTLWNTQYAELRKNSSFLSAPTSTQAEIISEVQTKIAQQVRGETVTSLIKSGATPTKKS